MGLLDNALQALKSQYQETKGNVGLLMSDPKRYMSGLNQDAAEYNRLSSLALQAERNAYRGLPVSAEQTAAKQYIDQQQQDMALGFTGSIKPVSNKPLSEVFGTGIIDKKIGDSTVSYQLGDDNVLKIFSLRTPQSKRGQGSAKNALAEITSEADKYNIPIQLDASPLDKKTRLDKLVNLYEQFGFKPTGEKVNALGEPVMYRNAKTLK